MDDLINDFQSFLQAIKVYGGSVLFELLLIGVFVYMVVRFLQGTRGARMLKGIGVVLVVVYLIVRLLGAAFKLDRVEFLYERFLFVAGVAAIVVFQPEIRRALMQLGETRLFRRWGQQESNDVDALVESATFLSRRKIGAVIAVERDAGLGGIGESGTRIDGELTAALLNTIFWPNSPLHDLGVIVSGGRITHAGVQFPLAESGELDQDMGSRHRAAVGMSQESNCVVIVVSEETGDVSVADKGKLIRRLSPEGLRGLLNAALGRGEGFEKNMAA